MSDAELLRDVGSQVLAERESDGLFVRLTRQPEDGAIRVVVEDQRIGETLELPVTSKEEQDLGRVALDTFHHPFAYAAASGIDTARFDGRPAEVLRDAA